MKYKYFIIYQLNTFNNSNKIIISILIINNIKINFNFKIYITIITKHIYLHTTLFRGIPKYYKSFHNFRRNIL